MPCHGLGCVTEIVRFSFCASQDYWEAAAEVNDLLESENVLETTAISTKQPAVQSGSNSRVILLSGLIALLAVILSYLALHIARSH